MNHWELSASFDLYSTIFWSVTYIECIRIGLQKKTYCVPFFAICMNMAWETLSLIDYLNHDGTNAALYFTYAVWMLLDIGIVCTYLLYGKKELKAFLSSWGIQDYTHVNKLFIARTLFGFAVVIGVILYLYFNVVSWKGYFSFINNLIMSALFISMLYMRKNTRGQSMSIAITKCIGTLCATITMILGNHEALTIIGIICFVLDVIYVILLSKRANSAIGE